MFKSDAPLALLLSFSFGNQSLGAVGAKLADVFSPKTLLCEKFREISSLNKKNPLTIIIIAETTITIFPITLHFNGTQRTCQPVNGKNTNSSTTASSHWGWKKVRRPSK